MRLTTTISWDTACEQGNSDYLVVTSVLYKTIPRPHLSPVIVAETADPVSLLASLLEQRLDVLVGRDLRTRHLKGLDGKVQGTRDSRAIHF